MTLIFLFAVVAGLPFLSYRNWKMLEKAGDSNSTFVLPRKQVYLQSVIMQSIVAILALFAALNSKLKVSLLSPVTSKALLVGLIFLVAALAVSFIRTLLDKGKTSNNLRHLIPRGANEMMWWVFACLFAGIYEEYIYRGVLFQLFSSSMENWWLAALSSAVVFAFSHAVQGTTSVLIIIPFALGFQYLALFSGGLWLPMAVHFIYNVSVSLVFQRQQRK